MTTGPHQGSAITHAVASLHDVHVVVRDGVSLATDVYLPALRGAPGRFPALLERTPYGRRRAVLVQAARFFARRGYAVVLQDVRGRFDSDGEWYFLGAHEGPDGFDTVAWIAAQPWCDGQVGTMGLSYSTATQQALAVLRPPALRSQFLGDGGYNYFHRTLRHSGAFELGVLLPYAFRMMRESQEVALDPERRRAVEAEGRRLHETVAELLVSDDVLGCGRSPFRHVPREARWFADMWTTADYTDYWKQPTLNMQEHVDRYPDLPLFVQTSWYGHHVWAATTKYERLRARGDAPKRLLIGPWLHGYEDYARSYAGEVDFGPDATLDLHDLRLRWFDQTLKGLDTGLLEDPPVRVFVMGGGSGRKNHEGRLDHGGCWRDEAAWPIVRLQPARYFLREDGTLRREAPSAHAEPARYVFDPTDPVPTVGGGVQTTLFPGFIQGGGFDQRGRNDLWACRDTQPLAARADVLVFQTPPLDEAIELTGPIEVRLWVSSSTPDTDFTAKLIDVYPPSDDWPHGFALNLTDGIVRCRYRNGDERPAFMVPGEAVEVAIELQATSNLFAPRHHIRLDISSSNYPRFDANPNTGEPLGRSRSRAVAQQVVYRDAARPSHVVLPIVR